jgi:RNA polymerase sigma factor (sigma-70 family)
VATHPSISANESIRTLFSSGTVSGLTDKQLLDRFMTEAGEGRELAFASLLERHGPMVVRVCRRVLGDPHEAEDAFQATFLILALRSRSIRGSDCLASWLYRVASNVSATARGAAARRRAHELKAAETKPLFAPVEAAVDLGPVIHEELDRIPERYRTVLLLCCLEGRSHHEAAQQLGWPLGTVQSRLARGRKRLRARLLRRGLAPSAAILTWPLPSGAAQAVLPATLAKSTVRLALTVGAADTMTTAGSSGAVMSLARRALRTMLLSRALRTGATAILAAGVIATGAALYAFQAARPDPAGTPQRDTAKQEPPSAAHADDGLLTVSGIVRMRDGSPVAGATARSFTGSDQAETVARTDAAGRFQIRGLFGNGCRLHVTSADERYQTVGKVRSTATRTELSVPLELTVVPALHHEVTILSQGRPAAGAQVVAAGIDFRVQGVTGQDGKVAFRVPARERISELAAWHPTLGVGGKRDLEAGLREGTTELSLLPPAPHKIRVVDTLDKPVGGLELAVSVKPEDSDWIVTKFFKACHVHTDADGTAIVPWAPRKNLQYVDVYILGSQWKKDETDLKQIKNRLITVHARRERTVQGRLVMPEGADPQGILVSGFGFGPANNGDIPYARARRDGTFALRVTSEHAYVLGMDDLEWACDPWSGTILSKDSARPAEITMKVYPATPLTVRVTRGPTREPLANAWVNLCARGTVSWKDGLGKKRSGTAGVRTWLTTDSNGVAHAGVGRGKQELRLTSGDWNEEQTVEVTSEKPIEVDFHRAWSGKRRITGRLMEGAAPFKPSGSLVARAWTPRDQLLPLVFEPVIHPDGTFEVALDAESATLFFIDNIQKLSGFAERVSGDTNIDVTMNEMASYHGKLVDENAQLAAGRVLEMYVKSAGDKAVMDVQTDKVGRFQFTGVPSNTPLQFGVRQESSVPALYIVNSDRMFNPGEFRENDELTLLQFESSRSQKTVSVPLAKSVESICANARATGMRGLVAILGDDSGDATRVVNQLFDDETDRARAVLSYLTLRVDAPQQKRDAAALTQFGWPRPDPGEIMLVVLDGQQKTLACRGIATKQVDSAVGICLEFIKKYKQAGRNALALLAEARTEAKRSGRRVWVIEGGPRCGPCFQLARWIEQNHATLDKDYVVVKFMQVIDDQVADAIAGLPIEPRDGIPWFAITEPDGTVRAMSRGPLGNTGYPSSVEEIRHFRQMLESTVKRISPDEIERLIKSL